LRGFDAEEVRMTTSASRLTRPARILGRLREAAAAYDTTVPAVARRAAALRREGWALEEADAAGLLDPRTTAETQARFTSIAEAFALQDRVNPRPMVDLAHDKVLFAEWLAARGVRVPVSIGVFERRGPGWTADGRVLAGDAEWTRLIAGIDRPFVLKPTRGHLGYDVRILRPEGGRLRDGAGRLHTPAEVVALMRASRFDGFVLQERMLPHADIAALTGSETLQTLRINTLSDGHGAPRLLAPSLRLSGGPGDTDNFQHGATGNLVTSVRTADGVVELPLGPATGGRGLRDVPVHPVTGRRIAGFTVPGWADALALVDRAVAAAAPLRTVGWDVGPTSDGPVIIEANPQWNPAWGHPDWPEAIRALREAAAAVSPDGSPGRRSRWSIR
jgi:hypothetical protein